MVASRTVDSLSVTRRRSLRGGDAVASDLADPRLQRRRTAEIRGLVELDGVNQQVLGEYTENNPEDWTQFGRS